jgi:hypothetical protein
VEDTNKIDNAAQLLLEQVAEDESSKTDEDESITLSDVD